MYQLKDKKKPEACLAKDHIASDNLIHKCRITSNYDICSENTPDILINQLHKTIVEMAKYKNESFKREYIVSRRLI